MLLRFDSVDIYFNYLNSSGDSNIGRQKYIILVTLLKTWNWSYHVLQRLNAVAVV